MDSSQIINGEGMEHFGFHTSQIYSDRGTHLPPSACWSHMPRRNLNIHYIKVHDICIIKSEFFVLIKTFKYIQFMQFLSKLWQKIVSFLLGFGLNLEGVPIFVHLPHNHSLPVMNFWAVHYWFCLLISNPCWASHLMNGKHVVISRWLNCGSNYTTVYKEESV